MVVAVLMISGTEIAKIGTITLAAAALPQHASSHNYNCNYNHNYNKNTTTTIPHHNSLKVENEGHEESKKRDRLFWAVERGFVPRIPAAAFPTRLNLEGKKGGSRKQ